MGKRYIIALDQGTTSSRAILYDKQTAFICAVRSKLLRQIYPTPGWVEHDALEIWEGQLEVMRTVVKDSGISPEDIDCIGITNQRETVVVWEKDSGKPVSNAIVWQCRRTAPMCSLLIDRGMADTIRNKTGLVVDAYFSGTKIKWILDNVPGAKEKANKGELLAGTIDTWLVWNLTGGRTHITDYTNASRTMLFNIHNLEWDDSLLRELDIPASMLPEVVPSSGVAGETAENILGVKIPISGIAGDQQAALFGQACFEAGSAKNTYGTGCFILMNTGEKPVNSRNRLLTTIAWHLGKAPEYALEGSVFNAGASVQWLRDEMGFVENSSDTETEALKVSDTEGVYVVPAFTGLGAPYWDMYARGTIIGLTRGSTKQHIIRATLEAIAYQSRDVLEAMELDSEIKLKELKVDGGACVNNFLMQFQADIMNIKVIRPEITETTAIGAAYLAGLGTGLWTGKDEIKSEWTLNKSFTPLMDDVNRSNKYARWKKAVERSMHWC